MLLHKIAMLFYIPLPITIRMIPHEESNIPSSILIPTPFVITSGAYFPLTNTKFQDAAPRAKILGSSEDFPSTYYTSLHKVRLKIVLTISVLSRCVKDQN